MSGAASITIDSSDVIMNTTATSNNPSAHKCQHCSKTFSRSGDLRRHTDAVHLKIKDFKCADCGKSFAQRISLQTHMNSHTGDTPYVCRVKCGHPGFRDPSSRKRHEYEKHAPPGFKCPEGCKSFRRKESLKTHIVRHHPAKASTYTDEQLSNKMTRARFNEVFLRPAIARAKARRRAEGYVSDEDYEPPGPAESEESDKPLAAFSGAPILAATAAPPRDDDFVEIEESATSLDPDQTSGPSEHYEQDDVPMRAERSPSPLGQWNRRSVSSNLQGPVLAFTSTVFSTPNNNDRRRTSARSNRAAKQLSDLTVQHAFPRGDVSCRNAHK
ncbi:hypothetical protein FRC04_002592 [Tulasnella sp. 424]|nr:hypothetical protein FRC04_002592 [Tulasnella sp. 424]